MSKFRQVVSIAIAGAALLLGPAATTASADTPPDRNNTLTPPERNQTITPPDRNQT